MLDLPSEIIKTRKSKYGYITITKKVDDTKYGGDGNLTMKSCYTTNGNFYIGSPDIAKFLCKKKGLIDIQPAKEDHTICSIGFNPFEEKWYGWSHRAIHGFSVGDKVKVGDCAYHPTSIDEIKLDCGYLNGDGKCTVGKINMETSLVPTELSEMGVSGHEVVECCLDNCVYELGKGEWTSETMDDVKQMAIDFARGVS